MLRVIVGRKNCQHVLAETVLWHYLTTLGKKLSVLEKQFIFSGGSRISPRRGLQFPRGGTNIRFCQIFPKTAWNWKNLGPPGGGARPLHPTLDPPMIFAISLMFLFHSQRKSKFRGHKTVSTSYSVFFCERSFQAAIGSYLIRQLSFSVLKWTRICQISQRRKWPPIWLCITYQ